MAGAIELQHGALRLALRPDLGGSIAGLWHAGTPVLRSTEPAALAGPRASACFPLLPYSNRLAQGRFDWQGQAHRTRLNFDDSPHPLHGVGWLRAWQLLAHDARSATLGYRHAPDADWPFAFEATQRITLGPQQLRLELALRNTDARPQPVGLGWHPYLVRRPGSHLRLQLATRWDNDALKLPGAALPVDGINAAVAELALDHCHSGWQGPALIDDDRFHLQLASDLAHVVVFTPAGQPHYCVEPVSHVTDAVHAADPLARGLRSLGPGDATTAWMRLDITPA